jgi:hypothetical protein
MIILVEGPSTIIFGRFAAPVLACDTREARASGAA